MIYSLDIGGTNTAFAWIEDGSIIKRGTWKTVQNGDFMISEIIKNAPVSPECIGISSGGFWSDGKCRVYSTVKDFSDGKFIKDLESNLSCRVFTDNDAHCGLRAEKDSGVLTAYSHCAYITLGSSLGCGIMLDGKILYGANGQAGSLFLMPEIYDGKNYIYDYYLNTLKITSEYKKGKYYGNFKAVISDSINGNAEAEKIVEKYILTAALKCFYIYSMFDVEAIALNGGVSHSKLITDGIKERIGEFFRFDESDRKPLILLSEKRDLANLYGAYLMAKEKNLENF